MSFRTIENLHFDNLALRALPIDPRKENYPRDVKDACFSIVDPTPVLNPKTVVWSQSALNLLDLDENEPNKPEFSEYFSGNKIIPGARPAAHCYCGHQFGYFSGQLGDGATMYLGEVINSKNERWEIQFKGAGKTPYSRTADGRKVLRSSLREFLCSEAMYHLGVPTTRAATTVTSDSRTERDIFYTGDIIKERCTIILRIAPTFIRFGSFEIFKSTDEFTGRKGPSEGNKKLLSDLTNYCIDTFYPDISLLFPRNELEENNVKRYEEFFFEVVRRTAKLVGEWQCFGFCHGVLNTDNMSVMGVTIDYGPFGFMEFFDSAFICNSSDENGRYSYENQPEMCLWNCTKLAEALLPLVKIDKRRITQSFNNEFTSLYSSKMLKKFGFSQKREGVEDLIESFLTTMTSSSADWTNVFRSFVHLRVDKKMDNLEEILEYILTQCAPLSQLLERSKPRIPESNLIALHQFATTQPMALRRMGVDPEMIFNEWKKREVYQTLSILTQETLDTKNMNMWRTFLTSYVSLIRKEIEELSEEEVMTWQMDRKKLLKSNNPKYILRNWIAQKAIDEAEEGNFDEARNVLKLLTDPFALNEDDNEDLLVPKEKEIVGCGAVMDYSSPANGVLRVT